MESRLISGRTRDAERGRIEESIRVHIDTRMAKSMLFAWRRLKV